MSARPVPITSKEENTLTIVASRQPTPTIYIHIDHSTHKPTLSCPQEVWLSDNPPQELLLESDGDCVLTFTNRQAFGVADVQLLANRPVVVRALESEAEKRTRMSVVVYALQPESLWDRGGPVIVIPPTPK